MDAFSKLNFFLTLPFSHDLTYVLLGGCIQVKNNNNDAPVSYKRRVIYSGTLESFRAEACLDTFLPVSQKRKKQFTHTKTLFSPHTNSNSVQALIKKLKNLNLDQLKRIQKETELFHQSEIVLLSSLNSVSLYSIFI